MRKTPVLVAVAILALMRPIGVWAEVPDQGQNTVGVGPTSSGPTMSEGSAGYGSSGIQAAATSSTTVGGNSSPVEGGSSYQYRPVPYGVVSAPAPYYIDNNGVIVISPVGWQSACPSGQTGYYVYDQNGNPVGMVCVANQAPAASPPPSQLAQQASSQQPWPNLVLGVTPGAGLTGLASWFWLGGGSPKMADATASAGGLTVTVRAALIDVAWDFGDGSRFDSGTDLGQAYPAQSNVQHVYQTDTYGRPAGYLLSASLTFSVKYSVNGGPWLDLGTKSKAYSRSYAVNQLQPQAVGSQ